MKKKIILILATVIIASVAFYIYLALREQEKKDEKFICNCQKNGTVTEVKLSSKYFIPQKTEFFFNKKKINYKKSSYDNYFLFSFDLSISKSSEDTLFIKDEKKTVKIYDFNVDTLIINKKRGLECDLKDVTINGKKQYAEGGIVLD